MLNLVRVAPWLLASLGVGLWGGAEGAQPNQPNLAGTWKLNAEKTAAERPDQSADPSIRQGYSRGGRPRVGTGVTSGGDMTGGRPSGGTDVGGARANLGPLGLYARPLPELVIVQTDLSITISDPRGTPRTYRTDGRKESEPLPGADVMETVARWKDDKLTTERKLGSFGSVREVYWLDARSHVLIVEVRLSGPQLVAPLEMRRIYDLAPGS
jgi:hypothetical protein